MTDQPLPAVFVADSIGLDFLNSVATPIDEQVEWVGSGEGLLSWLSQAELVPQDVLDSFGTSAAPGELDAVANQARALREWFRGFVVQHMGKPLKAAVVAELGPLNRVLARDEEFGQVIAQTNPANGSGITGLEWELRRRWRSAESLLIPIAQSMANLVTAEDFSDVKACQGHNCSLLFVDHTRGRARRWCSMAVCGNRAKQAAHRDRSAKGSSPAAGATKKPRGLRA
jgi:predicted RNA-binding Zn ribbon-like protein